MSNTQGMQQRQQHHNTNRIMPPSSNDDDTSKPQNVGSSTNTPPLHSSIMEEEMMEEEVTNDAQNEDQSRNDADADDDDDAENDEEMEQIMHDMNEVIDIPIRTGTSDGRSNPTGREILSFSLSGMAEVRKWDDLAIMRCFNMTIESHDKEIIEAKVFQPIVSSVPTVVEEDEDGTSENFSRNQVCATKKKKEEQEEEQTRKSDTAGQEEGQRWKPSELALPSWAVDPLFVLKERQVE